MITFSFLRPSRIVFEYTRDHLRMATSDEKFKQYEWDWKTRPREEIEKEIRFILRYRRKKEKMLILPRSFILDRRIELGRIERKDAGKLFNEKLRKSLPVPLEEICYGLDLEEKDGQWTGLFRGVPRKSLEEILGFLGRAGVYPDRIVPSDEASVPRFNLLPSERKREVLKKERRSLAREIFAGTVLCFLLIWLGGQVHAETLARQGEVLDSEVRRLQPEAFRFLNKYEEVRKFFRTRQELFVLLEMFRELSEKGPSSLVLEEFSFLDGKLRLKGSAASHEEITKVGRIFEENRGWEKYRLEDVRTRKKEERDYLEFTASTARRKETDASMDLFSETGTYEKRKERRDAFIWLLHSQTDLSSSVVSCSSSEACNRRLLEDLEKNHLKVLQLQPEEQTLKGNKRSLWRLRCEGRLEDLTRLFYGWGKENGGWEVLELRIRREGIDLTVAR